jgi:hypothetical protein
LHQSITNYTKSVTAQPRAFSHHQGTKTPSGMGASLKL